METSQRTARVRDVLGADGQQEVHGPLGGGREGLGRVERGGPVGGGRVGRRGSRAGRVGVRAPGARRFGTCRAGRAGPAGAPGPGRAGPWGPAHGRVGMVERSGRACVWRARCGREKERNAIHANCLFFFNLAPRPPSLFGPLARPRGRRRGRGRLARSGLSFSGRRSSFLHGRRRRRRLFGGFGRGRGHGGRRFPLGPGRRRRFRAPPPTFFTPPSLPPPAAFSGSYSYSMPAFLMAAARARSRPAARPTRLRSAPGAAPGWHGPPPPAATAPPRISGWRP